MSRNDKLINDLASPDPVVRDSAALDLMESGDSRAVAHLLDAILNEANTNHRATLVYALTAFNCSDHIAVIVRLAFDFNYEVSLGAFSLLADLEKTADIAAKVELELAALGAAGGKLGEAQVKEIRSLFVREAPCTMRLSE